MNRFSGHVPTHAGIDEPTSIEYLIIHDEWIEAHQYKGTYASYQKLYKIWVTRKNQMTIRQATSSFCLPKWWRAIVKE